MVEDHCADVVVVLCCEAVGVEAAEVLPPTTGSAQQQTAQQPDDALIAAASCPVGLPLELVYVRGQCCLESYSGSPEGTNRCCRWCPGYLHDEERFLLRSAAYHPGWSPNHPHGQQLQQQQSSACPTQAYPRHRPYCWP